MKKIIKKASLGFASLNKKVCKEKPGICWHQGKHPRARARATHDGWALHLQTGRPSAGQHHVPLSILPSGPARRPPPQPGARAAYSELLPPPWLRGSAGRLESSTWIPRELTARIRMVTMASTGSFSSTMTRQRLRRAALTWKEGFSVVAPIRVMVPHSTCGRNVS